MSMSSTHPNALADKTSTPAERQACCQIRKLEPLGRVLSGQRAWITGLRREQSNARADAQAVQADTQNGVALTKINPLVEWTWGDVWHYIARERIALPSIYYSHTRSVVERRIQRRRRGVGGCDQARRVQPRFDFIAAPRLSPPSTPLPTPARGLAGLA